MIRLRLPLLLALILSLCFPASAEDPPSLPPGKPFDLQGFIDRQLGEGNKRITIPPGRYLVTPRKRVHLVLENLTDIEIVAEGVEMICTETTRALDIRNCLNLTLTGLGIDYDPLPFTQGKITGISADGLVHDIQLFEGYRAEGEITGAKYEIFRPDTRELRFGSYHGCKVSQEGPGRLRVVKPVHYKKGFPERAGDIIAIACGHAPGGSIPHAVALENSRKVNLVGLKLYASNSFGFFESGCSGTVYRQCVVDRRPAETDLRERESPRIRSLNADAFHSKHAETGPSYIGCEARFQGDDCVAINGDYHLVMESKGHELRVLAKREMNISEGDPVELVSFDGMRLPDARVVSVKRVGRSLDEEVAFLGRLRLHEDLKNHSGGALTKAFRITIDRPVELPAGSLICSANRVGKHFKVIDCKFGFNRSRGILVKSSQGEIRGNQLDGCWMEAIKIAPEYWWLEAGSSSDVVVRDNVIKDGFGPAISVISKGGQGDISPAGAHRNITIRGNRIEDSPAPQILVTSTDGLVIERNTIRDREKPDLDVKEAIELKKCGNVEIRDNRTTDIGPQGTGEPAQAPRPEPDEKQDP